MWWMRFRFSRFSVIDSVVVGFGMVLAMMMLSIVNWLLFKVGIVYVRLLISE